MKNFFYLFIFSSLLVCCSDKSDRESQENFVNTPNCGEITRLWSQNVSDGNPCYNQTGLGAGDFTIQVTNNLTGNIKNFCVNISEYVRYDLGDTYCDSNDPNGW